MALLEIISVASFIPFMTLVGDLNILEEKSTIARIYLASGIDSEINFLFVLGACVLLILFISSMVSMFSVWRLSIFANKVGTEIADMLYEFYLKRIGYFMLKEVAQI